jgi:predicted GIY-YIG superfamily endonuclease
MNYPSEEQQQIINHIKNGYNVVVDACAGSGKSSTILAAASQLSNKQITQITYNSMLRHEIREKIKVLELENISVHTFHSLAVKYYLLSSHTDTELRHILFHNVKPRIPIPKIELLFLDETQDMSELYFRFVVKFIKDMGEPIQLLILGDYRQGLYEFKGSDIRFLTMADKIWENLPNLSNPQFIHSTLKMSYRITNQIAKFVNNVMLGEERLFACKSGEPVTYIRNSIHNIEKTVIYLILKLLSEGVKPNEIFVLGASVKGVHSIIRKMENIFVEQNIPCHVPTLEGDKLDERVIDGKIVFSTFHCVKGRQRKYVFVVGFDQNYFNHFARTMDTNECPNTLYVACTRASQGLYLLEYDQFTTDRPLDFLKIGHHDMMKSEFIHFKGIPRTIFYEESEKSKSVITKFYETPTKLIKFIPDPTMEIISPIIERIFIKREPVINVIENEQNQLEEIEIPNVIQTEAGFFEDVSDLNGIAIPCIYYDYLIEKMGKKNNSTNVLYTMIQQSLCEMKENEHIFLKKQIKEISPECNSIQNYLFLANLYIATQERLYFKLKQINISEYNWLTQSTLQKCKQRLDTVIGIECKNVIPLSEHLIIHHSLEEEHYKIDQELSIYFPENIKFRFSAIIDLITEESVWELKCTSIISIDHKIQLIIYAWLWQILDKPSKTFKIFNIKTGELWVLHSTLEELTQIIVALLKSKYEKPIIKTDEEFITSCNEYINIIYGRNTIITLEKPIQITNIEKKENWFCYLLRNKNPEYQNLTYNGSTNDPKRRLRQHNKEIKGGARFTSRTNGGWEFYCLMVGFPNHVNTLQCEWRWKHCTGKPGPRPKCYCSVHGRISGLNEVLHLDHWTSKSIEHNHVSTFKLYIVKDVQHLINRSLVPQNIEIIVVETITEEHYM